MIRMKISQGKGASRWNTRVTVSARMAPLYGITAQTQWKPVPTRRALRFRPATEEEIQQGETWPTQDLRKSRRDYTQYTVNIPTDWSQDLDTDQGVLWKDIHGVLWGEIPKCRGK